MDLASPISVNSDCDALPVKTEMGSTPTGDRMAATRDAFLSPGLQMSRDAAKAASEVKLLLDEGQAREIESRLRTQLVLDPHSDPAIGGGYRVTTLYCDTPDLEMYWRSTGYKRRKYRLRRYGSETTIYLERKTRRGQLVRKHRSTVQLDELAGRLATASGSGDWTGAWFHQQLLQRRLRPVCRLEYLRTALVGGQPGDPLRATFDRQLTGSLANHWAMEIGIPGIPLFSDRVVCEFKFCGKLPTLFKSILFDLQLLPGGVSKYRQCVQTLGIADRSPLHA